MHILLINSEFPPIGGGAGNASANVARNMIRMGNRVTILTARFGKLPQREIIDGVDVIRIPTLRRKIDRSGALEQAMFMLAGLLWCLTNIRKINPDIILAFFGAPSGVIALGVKILFGIPYIVSLRGGDVPGFRPYDFAFYHRLIGPLLHIVWRQAVAVVANSAGLRNLGRVFDAAVPINIIPNGVDINQFMCEQRPWQPARLLIVGRVVYQKGIDLLLQALAGISEMEWALSIAGDGPLREELQRMATELGISEQVEFLGWQSKGELVKRYCESNLYVYPSRHEGMPNVVLEAMSSGLPVVASKIAGNEELVLPGETGLLIPEENITELQAAIKTMIEDAELRKKMGAAARKRVEEQYTWESTAQQYIEIMDSALKRN